LYGSLCTYNRIGWQTEANKLFEIEPNNPENYVSLFNILVSAKLWSKASKARILMKERGVSASPSSAHGPPFLVQG